MDRHGAINDAFALELLALLEQRRIGELSAGLETADRERDEQGRLLPSVGKQEKRAVLAAAGLSTSEAPWWYGPPMLPLELLEPFTERPRKPTWKRQERRSRAQRALMAWHAHDASEAFQSADVALVDRLVAESGPLGQRAVVMAAAGSTLQTIADAIGGSPEQVEAILAAFHRELIARLAGQ
ncbi:MAG: hypothetical protein KJZ83_16520 [Burkholderiaceae bacterium]|nr:hypothetical protein [Burkholderiaceae bacterium]